MNPGFRRKAIHATLPEWKSANSVALALMSRCSPSAAAVGGLGTRGEPRDQGRAGAHALEHGISHFDTAPDYGKGASEENLGRVLAKLKPDVIVSTKVRVPADRPDIGAAIAASLEASLKRLGRDHVDVFQLHNVIGARADGLTMSADEVLGDVVPALARAREQGKTRFVGFTAIGETAALHRLVASRAFDTAQVPYNVLNPSPGEAIPTNYPAQDYARISIAQRKRASAHRHPGAGGRRAEVPHRRRNPLEARGVEPIGSGQATRRMRRARRSEAGSARGHAASLRAEIAVRFAIACAGTLSSHRDRACEYRRTGSGGAVQSRQGH